MVLRTTSSALALALLLTGCDLGPDYEKPQVELPVAFRATAATEATAWPSDDWWRGFGSAELNELID
jgi:outer membrane protein, multidrug efflux system